ncbi:carboxymuconolactone decarboxylase family protein [Microbacterium karelineae]|uniref:carboxymuconolactone decarboxylase family protein n=1 Tax=Microbacterium karelineae TaxID=2654283 RepID=UPI0018D4A22C|nr:carboxymuconolactone decarboxylase family protein [Microbacterium karelineae]
MPYGQEGPTAPRIHEGDRQAQSLPHPQARITGQYGAILTFIVKRMWGKVPDNAHVLWHNRRVMNGVLGIEGSAAKWNQLDPQLASYAEMASAGAIGCSWCLDFGYFLAHNEGLDLEKVREVPRWRESDVFTPLERDVPEHVRARRPRSWIRCGSSDDPICERTRSARADMTCHVLWRDPCSLGTGNRSVGQNGAPPGGAQEIADRLLVGDVALDP